MNRLIFSASGITYLVDPAAILYCKSDNNYTYIFTQEGDEHLLTRSISKVAMELGDQLFIRVSQSYLVNRLNIVCIDNKRKLLSLNNNVKIPYSVSKRDILKYFGPNFSEEDS